MGFARKQGGKIASSTKASGGKVSKRFQGLTGTTARKKKKGAAKRDKQTADKKFKSFAKKQAKEGKRIEGLFKKLQDPSTTAGELQTALGQIQKIDVSKFSGQAAADVQNLRNIAQTQGPTALAERLTAQQRAEETGRLEQIETGAAQRGAQAFEGLAQRGGAGAGARERLLASTGAAGLRESQAERRSGALARLGIGSEDEARKLDLLQTLPGQELAVGQFAQGAQQAEAQRQFGQATALQKAQAGDVGRQQQAQQFQAAGQASVGQRNLQQAGQVFGGQQLSDAQRRRGQQAQSGGALANAFSLFG